MEKENEKKLIETDEHISMRRAGEILACSSSYLTYLCRKKKLKSIKIGVEWMTKPEWINQFLETQNLKKERANNSPPPQKRFILPLYFDWQLRLVIEKAEAGTKIFFWPFKNYWQEAIALILLVAMTASSFLFFQGIQVALGATYTWVQTDWSGGVSTSTFPVHPTNQTDWDKYYSASSTELSVGTEIILASISASTTHTSDTDFLSGTFSNATTTGSGSEADVKLMVDPTAIDWIATSSWNAPATGEGTANYPKPAFADLDADGDYDLMIGDDSGVTYGYENTGATSSPSWAAKSIWDVGDIGSYTNPALADLDNDGDYDLMIGASDGVTYGYENTGATSSPSWTATSSWNIGDIGSQSNPGFADLDNDGDYDLLVGESAGVAYGYENTGTVSSPSWAAKPSWDIDDIGSYSSPALADLDNDGDYDLMIGSSGGTTYGYENTGTASSPSWTAKSSWDVSVGTYNDAALADLDNDGDYDLMIGEKEGVSYAYENTGNLYYSSGNFTSSAVDTGQNSNFSSSTLEFTITEPASTDLKFQLRSASTEGGLSSATWYGPTGSGDYYITSGQTINSVHDSDQWVQYKAYFSTSDISVSPTLSDITINYSYYPASAILDSSPYDSNDSLNVLSKIEWTESLPTSTEIKFQLRTAPDALGSPGSWTAWCGPDNATPGSCNSATYFTDPAGGETVDDILTDTANDQWLQYRVWLETSDTSVAPTLSDVTLTYVVNAPPEFDPTYETNGVGASQATTTGEVNISYKIRDPDTTSGTVTQNLITPSFEYNVGSGWASATSDYLAAGDLNNKVVEEVNWNTYSATWNATSQVPGTYTTSAQIRVIINDNEAANNTVLATSAVFALDTKVPTASSPVIDSSLDVITLNISDDNNIQYRLSNNSDLSVDGLNASSSIWEDVGATSTVATTSWTFTGSPSFETVYLEAKDAYGNVATSSATAPSTPSDLDIKDVTNAAAEEYRLFIAWAVYSATTSAQFSQYQIYRSTDGTDYSQLTTISDVNTNYLTDTNVASSTTYYYKLRIVDTDDDISDYSSVVNDKPNGQGGTDVTAPTISSVQAAETQATWARITWTTDELSDSRVDYSVSPSVSFDNTASSSSMLTSHSVVISGLSPNTSYLYRAKSSDAIPNEATDDNGGAGYSLTTGGGPIISNVTAINVSEKSATIFWNTNEDSNSFVNYSTSPDLSGSSEVGSSSLVGGSAPFQHKVDLTGLDSATTYYYQAKSTDADSDTAIDNNNGDYYQFVTTYDTRSPVISEITTPVITSAAAVIVWKTDELSDSQVSYGTVSGSLSLDSDLDSTLSIYHVVTLTDLSANTAYYYRVKSQDEAGNLASSTESSFQSSEVGERIIYRSSGGGGCAQVEKDEIPPSISNIEIGEVSAFGAKVSFQTDEPTIAFLEYGESAQYDENVASMDWSGKHTLSLTKLIIGTNYHFRIKAVDKAGNSSFSGDRTFTTKYFAEALKELTTIENAYLFQAEIEKAIESILPSILPPFIEEPKASEITENSAKIQWRTNTPAYSIVSYSSEVDYDSTKEESYIVETSQTETKTTEHQIELVNLKPDTLYHFRVKSFSLPQAVGKSGDLTFSTKALPITPRAIDVGKDKLSIIWKTDRPADSMVEYKNLSTGELFKKTDETETTDHFVVLENLTSDTLYEIKVSGYDERGNLIESGIIRVNTSKDITPPVISSIKIDSTLVPGRTDRIQTIVRWLTNEPANSAISYQEGTGSVGELANKIEITDVFVTDHVVILPAMKPGTLYQVQITSVDEAGNQTITPVRTIITPSYGESVFDVIMKNFQDTFKFLDKLR